MYLDVFLSFRGEDVRKKFLSHLCREFSRNCIVAFKKEEEDDKKETDKKISPSLLRAILKSKVAVVVFSKNYAYSTWCLDELDKIMARARKESTAVVPVFYEVDLSDVTSLTGRFWEALKSHAQVENPERLQRWKDALINLTNNKDGCFFSHKSEDDSKLISDITRHVIDLLSKSRLHKVFPPGKASGDEHTVKNTSLSRQLSNSDQLLATTSEKSKTPVAILRHMELIENVLDLDSTSEVRVIGISGVEGIGKTTVARHLYQTLSSAFQDHCFLETSTNILHHISRTQEIEKMNIASPFQKLSPASKDHCIFGTSKNIHDQGHNLAASSDSRSRKEVISPRSLKRKSRESQSSDLGTDDQKRTRSSYQRVLAIVDNVEKIEQLEEIIKDVNYLGSGSRVIIVTTQNKSSLLTWGVEHVYELDSLKYDEALELFSECVFKTQYPPANFEQLSFHAVQLTGCLPLGLKVLGSFLRGKTKEVWENELQRLKVGQDKAIGKLSELSTLLLPQDKTEEDWECESKKAQKQTLLYY